MSLAPGLGSRTPLLAGLLRRSGPLYHLANLLSSPRFVVEGDSMEPSVSAGDYLLLSRLEYRARAPARGDIVVVRDPVVEGLHHVKRILSLPGEEVCLQRGQVFIQGQPLDEPYPVRQDPHAGRYDGRWWLAGDEYFVLGDNRANSRDSRRFGPVKRHLILGGAWLRYWPRNRWGLLPRQADYPSPRRGLDGGAAFIDGESRLTS